MNSKITSAKWWPFCLGLDVLMNMDMGLPDGEMWVVASLRILPGKEEKQMCDNIIIDLIHKSQTAPAPYPTMLHSEQKCAHFCSEWSIVGYGISTGEIGLLPSTVWCCCSVNFLPNPHKIHPIARPSGRAMGCILRVLTVIYTLPQSLQRCMQYHVILGHVVTALDSNFNKSKLRINAEI